MDSREPRLTWRTAGGDVVERDLVDVHVADLMDLTPWRVVRSFHGRPHYAGSYSSSTTGGFVTYESRLELARILLADQDPDVIAFVSQPFLLQGPCSDGIRVQRRHVPDLFMVHRDQTVTIVNVKPASQLEDERVRAALEWAEVIIRSHGWRHEIWSGTGRTRLENLRFLAGYRHAERCCPRALELVRQLAGRAATIGQVERLCSEHIPAPLVRSALLHHVWAGVIIVDLDRPIDSSSPVALLERLGQSQ